MLMKRRATGRFYLYFSFIVCCVVISLAASRAEPILLGSFFAASLLFSFLDIRKPELEIDQSIDKVRFFEDDLIEVRITIRAISVLPILEIFQPLPAEAQLAEGTNDIVTSLKAKEEKTFKFSFSIAGRRRFEIGVFPVRIVSASGLVSWQHTHNKARECGVYCRPDFLRTAVKPFHTQVITGNYPSKALGEGVEFGDVRELAPGERANNINWRGTARRGKYLVNEYVQERNADVVLLIDTFTDIGDEVCNYLNHAARAAATFGHHLLRDKNRVGLIEFGFYFRYILPRAGGRQWYKILEELTIISVREREIWSTLSRIPPKILPSKALVIAITPLLDNRFTEVLMDLRRRGFDVLACIVSPVSIVNRVLETGERVDPKRDIAMRIWEAEWHRDVRDVQKTGLLATVWDLEQPLELSARLFHRSRQRRA